MKQRLTSGVALAVIGSSLLFAAPQRSGGTPQTQQLAVVPADVAALRKQIADLSKRLDGYEQLLDGVAETSSDSYLKAIDLRHETATLSPTSLSKYSRVDSEQASFLAVLENVEPYLAGFRLTVKIGNLSAADFPGFSLHGTWGPKFDKTKGTTEQWVTAQRTNDFSFTNTLRSGAWNRIEIILPNTDSAHFDYITLGITTNTVELNR